MCVQHAKATSHCGLGEHQTPLTLASPELESARIESGGARSLAPLHPVSKSGSLSFIESYLTYRHMGTFCLLILETLLVNPFPFG